MVLLNRLIDGFYLATESFTILWKNKILIVYAIASGILLLAGALATMAVFSLDASLLKDLSLSALAFSLPFSKTGCIIALTIFSLLITSVLMFCNATLIFHTTRLLHNQSASIASSLRHQLQRWWPITQWILLTTAANIISIMLISSINEFNPSSLDTIIFFLNFGATIIIAIIVFLVIACLALQHISVIRAIALSWAIVQQRIPELIGGTVWILTLGFVLDILIVYLPMYLLKLICDYEPPLAIMTIILTLLLGLFIQTIIMIFKAVFYDRYYQQKLEQMAMAEHDLLM
jgi:hypothetical protein